ncbi:SRPBCC family protein [Rhodococcus sp. NPDC004095]
MTESPAALADIPADALPTVHRIENTPAEEAHPMIAEMMHAVYPHEQIYGDYCSLQGYVDAPPGQVYDYLAHTRSLEEWTFSLRGFARIGGDGLWRGKDLLGSGDTDIYTRTHVCPEAMTVDYHCAWDQGEHLWMIYLMRVVDAQLVLDKAGSVVLWTNCHHPFYDRNPFPEKALEGRTAWVGDYWDVFYPGHQLELDNLTRICEYRHAHGLPVTPDWLRSSGSAS